MGGSGGVLLLLVGLYLLIAFLAGRLEWLFSLGDQVGAARRQGASSARVSSSGLPLAQAPA